MKVLITGGAGFIGARLARRLLSEGCDVTILDNFAPQVHGGTETLPDDLASGARLIVGDVRDASAMHIALAGQEVVVHLAAETGTGQSMYEVRRYEDVNIGGTAILMDYLSNNRRSQVEKVLVASSRAVYGEGKYHCPAHGTVYPPARAVADLAAGRYEPRCPVCGADCHPLPTDEQSPLAPASFYGLTKQVQEQMTLLFARTLGLAAFALRYQNVYGPGQSLGNPYTGILAIFATQASADQPIYIFEDGQESRDFVYIDDVVEATWACARPEAQGVETLNIGSGARTSVAEVVTEIVGHFASRSPVTITGGFRAGDIRHNVADLTKAGRIISYKARWRFAEGLREFLAWAASEAPQPAGYERSLQEMADKGLSSG
jgi:dTDP-L-rhamnose 4-epimerase